MQLLDAPLAIVDLETTGGHPAHDRVTEIALIEVEGGEVTGEWSTLVNPGTAIPSGIQALTGITGPVNENPCVTILPNSHTVKPTAETSRSHKSNEQNRIQ